VIELAPVTNKVAPGFVIARTDAFFKLAVFCVAFIYLAGMLAPLSGSAVAAESVGMGIGGEVAFVADDNVSRGFGDDKISDAAFNIRLNKALTFPVTTHTRLVVRGSLGTDQFLRYNGLTRYFVGLQADFQYRPSGKYNAPTFSIFARTIAQEFESKLRDGYRHSFGANALKPLTDRLTVFAAFTHNRGEGKSSVFDTRDFSGRVNVDFVPPWFKGLIYVSADYRRGDIVSTGRPALAFVDVADAIVFEDVFEGRTSYRFEADTVITTLGYNRSLGGGHALDFSWRWVRSESTSKPTFPGAESLRYFDNALSVAYLFRF